MRKYQITTHILMTHHDIMITFLVVLIIKILSFQKQTGKNNFVLYHMEYLFSKIYKSWSLFDTKLRGQKK